MLQNDENKYYLLDQFSCVSLFPPVAKQRASVETKGSRVSGSSNGTGTQNIDGPPPGVFRIQTVTNTSPTPSDSKLISNDSRAQPKSGGGSSGSEAPHMVTFGNSTNKRL